MEKENTKVSEAQKAAQKKYDEKTKVISVKYTPVDMADYEKMRSFLDESGQSANQFIKSLIHDYLDPEKKAVREEEGRRMAMERTAEKSTPKLSTEKKENEQKRDRRAGTLPEWFD
ncbi:MAG: hypothetical protein LUH19_09415 [Lachnospiraceae bacterium]|nr:hypothetical protein [Lachnospiraceae bacterium]